MIYRVQTVPEKSKDIETSKDEASSPGLSNKDKLWVALAISIFVAFFALIFVFGIW